MFYNRNLERAAKYFVASVRDRCGCKTLVINRDDGLSAISDGRYTYSPGILIDIFQHLFALFEKIWKISFICIRGCQRS